MLVPGRWRKKKIASNRRAAGAGPLEKNNEYSLTLLLLKKTKSALYYVNNHCNEGAGPLEKKKRKEKKI